MESFGGIHWNLTADPSNLQQFRLAVFILFLDSFLLCQIRITSRHLAGSLKAIARGLKEIHAFFVCRIDGCQFLVDLFDNPQVTQSQNLGIVRQMVTPNTLSVQGDLSKFLCLFVGLIFGEGMSKTYRGHGSSAHDQFPVQNLNGHLVANLLKSQCLAHGHREFFQALFAGVKNTQIIAPPDLAFKETVKELIFQKIQALR